MAGIKDLPEVRAKLKPTLLLVRHGQTKFDEGVDQHQGWENTGLDAKGVKQSKHLEQVLTALPIARIYTSDLRRAAETARIIAPPLMGYSGRFALRPWNVGQLVGKAKKDVQDELESYEFEKPGRALPGGESFNEFRDRYLLQFQSLLEIAKEEPSKGIVIAVTHSWNILLALAWLSAGGTRKDLDGEVLRMGTDIAPPEAGGM